MPPKVDPSEVRFSTYQPIQSILKFSVDRQVLQLHLLPNLVLSAWYSNNNQERKKSWRRYRQGGI